MRFMSLIAVKSLELVLTSIPAVALIEKSHVDTECFGDLL